MRISAKSFPISQRNIPDNKWMSGYSSRLVPSRCVPSREMGRRTPEWYCVKFYKSPNRIFPCDVRRPCVRVCLCVLVCLCAFAKCISFCWWIMWPKMIDRRLSVVFVCIFGLFVQLFSHVLHGRYVKKAKQCGIHMMMLFIRWLDWTSFVDACILLIFVLALTAYEWMRRVKEIACVLLKQKWQDKLTWMEWIEWMKRKKASDIINIWNRNMALEWLLISSLLSLPFFAVALGALRVEAANIKG